MNPNNCETCKHKKNPDGGWCYLFRDEPETVCYQHTGRAALPFSVQIADVLNRLGGSKRNLK